MGWSCRKTSGRPDGGTCTAPSTSPSLASSPARGSLAAAVPSKPERHPVGVRLHDVGRGVEPMPARSGSNQSARGPGHHRSTRAGRARALPRRRPGRPRAAPERQHRPGVDHGRTQPRQGVGGARAQHGRTVTPPLHRDPRAQALARRPESEHLAVGDADRRTERGWVSRPRTLRTGHRSPPPSSPPAPARAARRARTPGPLRPRRCRPAGWRAAPRRGRPTLTAVRRDGPARPARRPAPVVWGPGSRTVRERVTARTSRNRTRVPGTSSAGGSARGVPQPQVGAADQLPASRGGGGVDGRELSGQRHRPGRHPRAGRCPPGHLPVRPGSPVQ